MGTNSSGDLGLTSIDLFCGAGGLSEGFRAAGFDVLYALDNDADSCATYRLNHPTTKIEPLSIADVDPQELATSLGPVDVILGGPSCQGFSTHGRRERWADFRVGRNQLWKRMLGIVEAVRPRAFLLENVPGLTYAADGRSRKKVNTIVDGFQSLGYDVQSRILLAANFGVPQLRRRVFLVGVEEGLDFVFPEGAHLGAWRRDTIEQWEAKRIAAGKLPHLSCWEAIGDLPSLGNTTGLPVQDYATPPPSPYAKSMRVGSRKLRDHEAGLIWPAYEPLLAYIPQGGTWRDIPRHLLPDRYRGMRRTDSTNLLGRLDPVRPAYTITTQFHNISAGCFTHPFEDRCLTVREGARLQSFPDRYQFVGSIRSRCRQIGNAVPPLLAHHLAAAIAKSIGCETKANRPPTIQPAAAMNDQTQPPSALTKRRMQGQARRDTKPEVLLRKSLAKQGLRYRKNVKLLDGLRREVDVHFGPTKVAVFVDGCFWHGCPEHQRPTKSNTKWWSDKIANNRSRDAQTTKSLEAAGYRVIRVWEHEEPEKAARRIATIVRRRTPRSMRGT